MDEHFLVRAYEAKLDLEEAQLKQISTGPCNLKDFKKSFPESKGFDEYYDVTDVTCLEDLSNIELYGQ